MTRAQRVVVFLWDGMRPDHVRPDLTPNLHRLAADGTWYRRSAPAFPSFTIANMTSLATGAYPSKHGVFANELPTFSSRRSPILNDVFKDLEGLRAPKGGRILPVKTLAEALSEAGKKVVTVGSGPLGHGALFDPERTARAAIHTTFAWPRALAEEVSERFGAPPTKAVGDREGDEWVTEVLLRYVLPELEPDVVLVYCNEPDTTQHARGLGSPEALGMIRGNDEQLGRVLDAVDASGVPTAVLVVSDHGHHTVSGFVDLGEELREGGFARELADGRLFYGEVDSELTVEDGPGAEELAGRLGAWLAGRSWLDALFCWAKDGVDLPPGAVPLEKLWNDELRVPPSATAAATFLFSCSWTDATNERGVPGSALYRVSGVASAEGFMKMPERIPGFGALVSSHGSLNPYDLNNTLVLGGAGIRRQGAVEVPAGIVDVAPTVLSLLGLPPLPEADGRALTEAFEGGPEPEAIEVCSEELAKLPGGPLVRNWVGATAYLARRADGATTWR
jgi:arylsulfatase A-like enzyme